MSVASAANASINESATARWDRLQSSCQRTTSPTRSRHVSISSQRGEPDRVGVRHALSLRLREGQPSSMVKANRPPVVSARRYLLKQRLLVGKGEHGLEQEHHVERAGRDRRDPRDLEATRKVAGPLACDVDGARAEVHAEIGATELPGDEPSGPGHSAAQVQHGDPGCDAGSTAPGPGSRRRA